MLLRVISLFLLVCLNQLCAQTNLSFSKNEPTGLPTDKQAETPVFNKGSLLVSAYFLGGYTINPGFQYFIKDNTALVGDVGLSYSRIADSRMDLTTYQVTGNLSLGLRKYHEFPKLKGLFFYQEGAVNTSIVHRNFKGGFPPGNNATLSTESLSAGVRYTLGMAYSPLKRLLFTANLAGASFNIYHDNTIRTSNNTTSFRSNFGLELLTTISIGMNYLIKS